MVLDAHGKDDGHAEACGLVVERVGADVRDLGLRGHHEQADQVAPRRRRRLLLAFLRVALGHIVLAAHLDRRWRVQGCEGRSVWHRVCGADACVECAAGARWA